MYNLFKNSLFNPQALLKNVKDRWLKVWSYFFLMVLLSLIPFLIIEFSSSNLSSNQKVAIVENYNDMISGDFKIEDGLLKGEGTLLQTRGMALDLYGIYFNKNKNDITDRVIILNFVEDGIEVNLSMMHIKFYSYKSIGLEEFDFSNKTLDNSQRFLSVVTNLLDDNMALNKSISIFVYILSHSINFLIYALFAVFTMPNGITFKTKYKLGIYLLAPVMILDLFSVLFGISILSFVGFVVYIINVRRVFILNLKGDSNE